MDQPVHLLWDPLKTNRFAVGSRGVVRLYSWESKVKRALELNWKGDLTVVKSLAWSPHSAIPLLASANATGTISLISLPHRSLSSPSFDPPPPAHTFTLIPPRASRTTTCLAFSPPTQDGTSVPFLLAQGFTKIRTDSSVFIWDVSRMHNLNSSSSDPRSEGAAGGPRGFFLPLDPSGGTPGDAVTGTSTTSKSGRPSPLYSLIPSETILDLTWMDSSLLAVSTAKQYIRLYDIRTGSSHPCLQFGPTPGSSSSLGQPSSSTSNLPGTSPTATSSGGGGRLLASGMASDPFSIHRLAAYDEGLPLSSLTSSNQPTSLRDGRSSSESGGGPSGGTVRVWDTRSPRMQVLRLDGPVVKPAGGGAGSAVGGGRAVGAGAVTAAGGGGELRTGAVAVKWDLEREGRLVVLERGGDLSLWDLVDPLKGEGGGEGLGPLVVKGEPIRIPPGPHSNSTTSLTFSYVHPDRNQDASDEEPASEELQCRLATFSAAQGGEVLWPEVIERSPLAISSSSNLLYGPNLNIISPLPQTPLDLSPYPTRRPSQSRPASPRLPTTIDHNDPTLPLIPTTTNTSTIDKRPLVNLTRRPARAPSPLRQDSGVQPVLTKPIVTRQPSRGRALVAEKIDTSDGDGEDDEAAACLEEDQQLTNGAAAEKAARLLSRDVGVVMKTRAERGYGLHDMERNSLVAAELGEQPLVDFWNWFGPYSERFSSSNPRSHSLDFSFIGVRQLWLGFNAASLPLSPSPSGAATPSHAESARKSRSTNNSNISGFNLHLDDVRKLPRTHAHRDESPADNVRTPRATSPNYLEPVPVASSKDFARACAAFNDRRAGGKSSVMVPLSVGSKKVHERVTALGIVGWDLGEGEIEEEVRRLESIGKYERAAFSALFSGRIERSIEALDKSKDQHLKAIALTLLIHLQHPQDAPHDRLPRHEMHLSRVNELGNPYLRAVWRYGLTGDLEEVLTEEGLPLVDRLGMALKFAHDGRVSQFLRSQSDYAISSADLLGLSITGLFSSEGFDILRAHLRKNSDVQTVSILAAHTVPGRVSPDLISPSGVPYADLALRWIGSYESYLHRSILFMERATFREAKGRLARERGATIPCPVQVVVRCNFCNKNVSSAVNSTVETATTPSGHAVKGLHSHICPTCHNALPRCSICMKSLGQALDKSRDVQIIDEAVRTNSLDSLPLFCPLCRHGGHRSHLMTWFFGSSSNSQPPLPSNHPLYDPKSDLTLRRADRARRFDAGLANELDEEEEDEDEGNASCPVAGCECKCFG
ncbi:hypothetical protein BDY24DRAFT_148386 [Mrakia frigida]|uniref:Sea4p n=1 Tax=Mrakia frigida TaxID=29902 RepID=UPI003FCC0736